MQDTQWLHPLMWMENVNIFIIVNISEYLWVLDSQTKLLLWEPETFFSLFLHLFGYFIFALI